MKILFISYPHVGLGKGGMYYQILNTKIALENLGHEVTIFNFMTESIDSFDVCHFFATNSVNLEIVRFCAKSKVPIFLSSVFNSFNKSDYRILAESLLARFVPGFLSNLNQLNLSMRSIKKIIALNEDEVQVLNKSFAGIESKVVVIPNGVDINIGKTQYSGDKNKKMVLNVGEICPRKNQLNLIKAAQGKSWELHLVGPQPSNDYTKECIDLANKLENVYVYGALPYGSEELVNLYQTAKVFCLPSRSEVQPLTFIEAAQCNCNIVTGRGIPVQSIMEDGVDYCNVNSVQDIANKVDDALLKQCDLAKVMSHQPSWNDVAERLIKLYVSEVTEDGK